jgi:hypothetical protein
MGLRVKSWNNSVLLLAFYLKGVESPCLHMYILMFHFIARIFASLLIFFKVPLNYSFVGSYK